MKQLSKFQTILFAIGGALMVIGAGCYCFLFQRIAASIVFLIGAIMFSVMQSIQSYDGSSFTIRRLKSIMSLATLMFVVAGILMIDNALFDAHRMGTYSGPLLLRTLFSNIETYLTYIYNKWLPAILIGAILEVYTNHRITSELKKEQK